MVKGLTRAVHQSKFETSSGKSFIASAEKGITQRWGSICTISADKENLVILAAALDPRYRKLKFLTPEDGIRLQGSVEVLAVKEAKTTTMQNCRGPMVQVERVLWKPSFSLTQTVRVKMRMENLRRTERSKL